MAERYGINHLRASGSGVSNRSTQHLRTVARVGRQSSNGEADFRNVSRLICCGRILNMPDSVILRYRDLGTPNAVRDHQAVITSAGYTWWGWWKKDDEADQLRTI